MQQIWAYRAARITRLQVKCSDDIASDNTFNWSGWWNILHDLRGKWSSWIIRQRIQAEVALQQYSCIIITIQVYCVVGITQHITESKNTCNESYNASKKLIHVFTQKSLEKVPRISPNSDTIQQTICTCAQKLTSSSNQLNLPHGIRQTAMKKLKTKTEMLGRNGPVIKSVESVPRLEGSLWWEREFMTLWPKRVWIVS